MDSRLCGNDIDVNKDAKIDEQRLTNGFKIPTIVGSQLASAAVFAAIVCRHEKNIPTKQPKACSHAWFPCS